MRVRYPARDACSASASGARHLHSLAHAEMLSLAHRTCLPGSPPIRSGVNKLVPGSSSSPPPATWARGHGRALARTPSLLRHSPRQSRVSSPVVHMHGYGRSPADSGFLHVFRAIRHRQLGRCTVRRAAVQPESPRPAETSLANPSQVRTPVEFNARTRVNPRSPSCPTPSH